MIDRDRERAMLRAVEFYYFEGFTQAAISERLGCTRWTVGRLLKEATDAGVVEINIHHERARRHDLEQRLECGFGLVRARVVPTGSTPRETMSRLAHAGADFLTDIRPRPRVVGVAYGRTMGAMARALPERWIQGVTVVQIAAAPANLDDAFVGSSIRMISRRGNGVSRTLPSVPVFATAEQKRRVEAQEEVATCLGLARKADVVFYSPGPAGAESLLIDSEGFSPAEAEQLRGGGAVAVIGNRLITAEGEPADAEVDQRTLGVGLDDLRQARLSVAVGGGADKHEAFRAIVRGRLANVLVIDSDTAEMLLEAGLADQNAEWSD